MNNEKFWQVLRWIRDFTLLLIGTILLLFVNIIYLVTNLLSKELNKFRYWLEEKVTNILN